MNNMEFIRKLPIPKEIKEQFPLSDDIRAIKETRDKEIAAVFTGESDKFLLIIGPCSADREEAVLEYIGRLAKVQEKVKDKIIIIPRIYTNKPRTTGEGYKGMVHQPDPNKKEDMLAGLIAIRELHHRAVRETGLTCADEMLYPENHRYLDDLLAYVSVGARSVEDQQHRLTASGLEIPVGMKNPPSGDLQVMLNAIHAAQTKHTFIYRGWAVHSAGNPLAHAILRGYLDPARRSVPNYHKADLQNLAERYAAAGLENPALLLDANHANSDKDPFRQPEIVRDVLKSCAEDPAVRRLVKGFMIESYIEDGCQPVGGGTWGQSITDPCLGWEKTRRLLYELAEKWTGR